MKLDGVFKVSLPEETYEFDLSSVTVADGYLIKSELGNVTFRRWFQLVDEGDPDASQVLIWYLRRKDGRTEERNAVDFPLFQLSTELVSPPVDLPESPAASVASEAATSPSSPESSESDPGNGTG